MKEIFVDLKNFRSVMSPIGYRETKEYKAVELETPGFTKFVSIVEHDKVLIILEKVKTLEDIEQVRAFLEFNKDKL
jgi:hypothetical protein